ncbi:serine/threonine-protein kinase NIM1-like [Stegodyphus dumicola]|uniref:serine/threonine-protein kinase NIM1-like n=1 Tax=Stegodyphus dumicola TaxID=202533 RepID=UPI0015A828DB|nr:serine/threonine-protein kinase NIM1-like [Stegodyphus dumicola]XP_035230298.1 serine/threonine-protein kinase NIM1-like [Stegodyphus dumicola]
MCINIVVSIFSMPAAKVSPASNSLNGRCQALQSSRESTSSECPSLQETTEDEDGRGENNSPYLRAVKKLQTDEKWQKDITLGRRIGFYRMKEELGTGNFSQVKAATHALTKERVAVKILDKAKLDKKTQMMLAREIASMESLHHPHVIRLYEVLETFSKIYLVMEHANGGELFHRISQNGHFSEKSAKPLFAQITAAVDHMHFHNIVHRDLKAENVFFAGPNIVKVGDFGFSTHIRDVAEPLRTFCGSPPYAAPELFRDDSYVGPMVDVWALGVLLYFMLTASMPFKATTVAGLKKQILEGDYTIPDYLSSDCHFLVLGILKQDPKSRITLDQIMRSNWLSIQNFPEALPRDKLQTPTENCSENGVGLSVIEITTRQKLKELGITEEMIEESKSKGSRSSVMGTYRIVLHKVLAESGMVEITIPTPETPSSPEFLKSDKKKVKVIKNKKSKMCIIL